MAIHIEKRIGALETQFGTGLPSLLLIVRQIVSVGHVDQVPIGIHAAPPHFSEPIDRMQDESWSEFVGRLEGNLAHLPTGSVVRVTTRCTRH